MRILIITLLLIVPGTVGFSASRVHYPGTVVSRTDSVKVFALDSVPTGCQLLYNKGNAYSGSQPQMSYDTLKRFIETCPNWEQSWRAFGLMTDAVLNLGYRNPALYGQYGNWLDSVLYLNTTDPEYFCVCVEQIAIRFQNKTGQWNGFQAQNIALAVVQWLLLNTDCDTSMLRNEYNSTRESQRQSWLDDTTIHRDTTLPTMTQLGFDSLLALHFKSSVAPSKPFATIVPSHSVTENPLDNETTLHFTLSEASFAKVDVLDVLGREVAVVGTGRILDPGEHQLPVDLSGSTSGTYYLRIALGTGEVRTIKLVKK